MDDSALYRDIEGYLRRAGERLVPLAGKLGDSSTGKVDQTDEDLRIERELEQIIRRRRPDYTVISEEKLDRPGAGRDRWYIDPISGTAVFKAGAPHYAIVATHVRNEVPVYTSVYDPAVGEFFIASADNGAALNGKRLDVGRGGNRIALLVASGVWPDIEVDRIWHLLRGRGFQVYRPFASMAVSYASVAAGRYAGVISLTKDSFPERAGQLLIQEAGGRFEPRDGEKSFYHARRFIGGNDETFSVLSEILQ